MATEPLAVWQASRRQALAWLGSACWASAAMAAGLPAPGSATLSATLWAAWQDEGAEHIGEVRLRGGRWAVGRQLAVPTRAHGLVLQADGSVLVVARRPGDWLLRWHPQTGQTQWQWVESDRRFNGHVVADAAGQRLWTTETDLESVAGMVALRDGPTLHKQAEWPTHGADPHQLMLLPQALGGWPAGTLVVANGGIPTLPETGRAKRQLDKMDPSLVALGADTGARLGQWRLPDAQLSIHHLALDGASGLLGIALQAEHADAATRTQAPVLALWDGAALRLCTGQPPMGGYGGDIVALPGGGFAVSCPRVDAVAVFDAGGQFQASLPFKGAYALGRSQADWWVGGAPAILQQPAGHALTGADGASALRWDNHWVAGAGTGSSS